MRKLAVSLLGLMLATSTVVACGGSSGKSGSSDTQPQVTTGDTGGDGSASDAFSQLVAQASTANIKITYAQSDGDSVTIAQDGNGKTAYQSGDSTFYTDGDTTVSCSGTGADAECTQIPGGGAIGTSILTVFTTLFSGLAKLDSSVYSGHESSETTRDATRNASPSRRPTSPASPPSAAVTSATPPPRPRSVSTRRPASS